MDIQQLQSKPDIYQGSNETGYKKLRMEDDEHMYRMRETNGFYRETRETSSDLVCRFCLQMCQALAAPCQLRRRSILANEQLDRVDIAPNNLWTLSKCVLDMATASRKAEIDINSAFPESMRSTS